MDLTNKKKVLFICTHNSARSQIAEGLLRTLFGKYYDVYSAGIEPSSVHPLAIKVMAELGIDISMHRSKIIENFRGMEFDYVVTVCDQAKETCPFFPGGKNFLHQGFKDPSTCTGTEEEKLTCFRRTREEIRNWVEKTFGGELKQANNV
ncbi:MAG: arsenate reductase ArsC [Candidatus Heimdallarchaeota archaeon]